MLSGELAVSRLRGSEIELRPIIPDADNTDVGRYDSHSILLRRIRVFAADRSFFCWRENDSKTVNKFVKKNLF